MPLPRPLDALPPPLVGVERPLLGTQLAIDAPSSAAPVIPYELEAGSAGTVHSSYVSLGAGGPGLTAIDLPCVVAGDFAVGLAAEIRRRHPEVGVLETRPVPVRDATMSVVEAVPSADFRAPDNEHPLAFFGVDLGSHVVLLRAITGSTHGNLDPEQARAARVLVESMVLTLRRGAFVWTASLSEPTYGDLFDSIDAPAGWVLRISGCCNEEPPYVTHFREGVIPLRALGEAPRARVMARSGGCPPVDSGHAGPSGRMFGARMIWARTANGLCWVERPPDGALELGVSWHVRGATEADVAEALSIASTAARR